MEDGKLIIPYGMTKTIEVEMPKKDYSIAFYVISGLAMVAFVVATGGTIWLIIKNAFLK